MGRARDIANVINSGTFITPATASATYATQTDFSNTLWTTFTPTTSGITIGNGTFDCRFKQVGKSVFACYRFIYGSTTSFTGGFTFSLPVTQRSPSYAPFMTSLIDANGSYSIGHAWYSGDYVQLWTSSVNATYQNWAYVTNTVPFTWAVSDSINFHIFYEAI
jgi:hypothetical protein